MTRSDRRAVQDEFTRVASSFAERTRGRFDALGVTRFARVRPHDTVLEVGAGTGNFLGLFSGTARHLIALDLTHSMLIQARARLGDAGFVEGDGARLPLASRSVDLVTSAQTLHHIHEPVPVLEEMRRVVTPPGRVLLVDQVATESYEEMAFMNELEALRDPTHAASRPPSTMRMLVTAAGLRIVDEAFHEDRSTFSAWMWPEEFPEGRIERVRRFIERFGAETGMEFEREGGDWSFTRRRMMLLAQR